MAARNSAKEKSCYIFLTIFFISFTLVESTSKYSYLLEDDVSLYDGTIEHVPFEDPVSSRVVKRDVAAANATSSPPKKAFSPNTDKKVKQKITGEVVATTTDAPVANKTQKPVTQAPVLVTELPDLPEYTPANNYTKQEDSHDFYNSTFYSNPEEAMNFWVNLTSENVTEHPLLSNSYRRAATVSLSFDFPFHGHIIRNITIATGGFLYTGNIMHTWLAATQYIAPLMANIDTSVHVNSTVRYFDNGTSFTVEWDEVYLQDKNKDGPFSFQVTLKDNGDIVFVYKKVQVAVTDIDEGMHPVKVGLSDAYIIDKTIFFIRRKTIYEYSRIDKKVVGIGNGTAIYFIALPTCLDFKTCETCQASNTSFECSWCSAVERCSSGLDRGRQQWLVHQCDEQKTEDCSATTLKPITTKTMPASVTTSPSVTTSTSPTSAFTTSKPTKTTTPHVQPEVVTLPNASRSPTKGNAAAQVSDAQDDKSAASVGAGAVIAILLIVALVAGFSVWVVYAYKFPQTPSGQLLIKYRPSQWRLRHGEARYTAASIHI